MKRDLGNFEFFVYWLVALSVFLLIVIVPMGMLIEKMEWALEQYGQISWVLVVGFYTILANILVFVGMILTNLSIWRSAKTRFVCRICGQEFHHEISLDIHTDNHEDGTVERQVTR